MAYCCDVAADGGVCMCEEERLRARVADLEAATDWLCLAKDAFTPQRCLKRSGHDGEHRGWIDREREQAATIERLRGALEQIAEGVTLSEPVNAQTSVVDGFYRGFARAALTGSDLGPVKSPNLWADVRDGSPGDVGWDGEDRGCSKCGADAGAQCSFQTVAGDGCEVGGWVHVERLEATDPDTGPGEGSDG